jgi:hypothetical protein
MPESAAGRAVMMMKGSSHDFWISPKSFKTKKKEVPSGCGETNPPACEKTGCESEHPKTDIPK